MCGNYFVPGYRLAKILESVERGQTTFYIAVGNGPGIEQVAYQAPKSKTSCPRKDGNSARIACPVFFGGGEQTFSTRVEAQLGLASRNRSRARARHKTLFSFGSQGANKPFSFLCLGVFRESIRSGVWRYIRTSAQSRPSRITCSKTG